LILPQRLRKAAQALRGDHGLRQVFRQTLAAEVRTLELLSAAADLDTPADLRAARSLRMLAATRHLRR
ncbi:MAG TPA: hypothetical protein VKT22_12660, partial [Steroidobacteraceae bacterium]|nr:hypothetical protein [Steroidobacteraceae bacterium]